MAEQQDAARPVEEQRTMHRAMALSRAIETHCIESSPHWYPSIGEEAVLIGTWSRLRPEDFAVPHYRGALVISWLRGRSVKDVLGTFTQRKSSPTKGRLYGAFAGGIEHKVMPYITMVLGPNLAVAGGIALAYRQQGTGGIVVASTGDGTAGTGDFHESLNIAAALRLPVVFVCQNNQVSISTSTRKMLAGESIADWAARYGMPSERIDGNDVLAVADAVDAAAARARAGEGPSFVEALTWRRTGHFGGDPAVYRDQTEAEAWAQRDPIARIEEVLVARGADTAALAQVHADAAAEVAAAAAQLAEEEPLTAADLGVEEVYAHGR